MIRSGALLLFAALSSFAQSTHWFSETFHNPPGTPLTAGDSVSFTLPPDYPCAKLTSYGMLINQIGTASIDVWRVPAWGFPTSANSITGGASPWVDYLHKATTTLPSTWKVTVAPNDVFVFYIDYITGGANEATLVLGCK